MLEPSIRWLERTSEVRYSTNTSTYNAVSLRIASLAPSYVLLFHPIFVTSAEVHGDPTSKLLLSLRRQNSRVTLRGESYSHHLDSPFSLAIRIDATRTILKSTITVIDIAGWSPGTRRVTETASNCQPLSINKPVPGGNLAF